MRYRMGMIIVVFTVFLFAIAGAAAGDVNESAIASENDVQAIESGSDILAADENNEVLGEADNGTFMALENKIKNGYGNTITLENNYEYEGSGYTNGIVISNSITIDGKGHTIDAKKQARIFHIQSDNVILKNITFANGQTQGTGLNGQGGAILWQGNGEVSHCTFTNNTANTALVNQGGAIRWYSGIGRISDCIFTNNNADHSGGAVSASYAVNVFDSIFINNQAPMGGAIDANIGEVSGCLFKNNHATDTGGAIYLDTSGSILKCVFINNTAPKGIISSEAFKDSNINSNIFLNNSAEKEIYYEIQPENSNFDNNWFGNTANNYQDHPATLNGISNNWLFLNATATPDTVTLPGTSQINFKLYSYSTTEGVSEYNNTLLYPVNLTLTATNGNIQNTTGLNETVTYTATDIGTGIITATIENVAYTKTLPVTTDGTTFWDLNQTINGNDNATITLDRNYAFNPDVDSAFKNGINITRPVTIIGNGYTINAKKQARIFHIQTDNVILKNITFANGQTQGRTFDGQGGAILWQGNGEVSHCTFTNNTANTAVVSQGGAIDWYSGSGRISDCIFTNNNADDAGGALSGEYGITVSDSIFINNSADEGGAIDIIEGDVSGCIFIKNHAKYGGAISLYESGPILKCVFINNTATHGIIRSSNFKDSNINSNIFLNNSAEKEIYCDRDPFNANFDNNWFGNTANNYQDQPATLYGISNNWLFLNATATPDTVTLPGTSQINFKLYSYSKTEGVSEYDNTLLYPINLTLTATNGNIQNTTGLNEAVTYTPNTPGPSMITAAIENVAYTKTLPVTTDGTTFWDLNQTINGNDNATITLDRNYAFNPDVDSAFKNGISITRPVTIIGNGYTINAKKQARIFHIQSDNVILKNITFANGQTQGPAHDGQGGAIFWQGNGEVSHCTFTNNTANTAVSSNGGAIRWNDGIGRISDCIFTNNNAKNGGGALSGEYGITVSDSIFINNSAAEGGAIYMDEGDVVSGCIFINNHANYGSVINLDESAPILKCVFINNTATNGIIRSYNFKDSNINSNIFLNNSAEKEIYYEIQPENSNFDNNWFGNTANNYQDQPATLYGISNNWLFLNATATPDTVTLPGTSQINFKLYSYSKTEGVSEYDNTYPIKLTVTATNGNIQNNTGLNEAVTYTATDIGTGRITATIEDAACTIELNIRANPDLSVENNTLYYSNDTAIALAYNSTATGKVNITLKGKNNTYTFTDIELNSTISLGKISPDEYGVTVSYSGDATFSNATAKATLTVEPAVYLSPDITSDKDTYFLGDIVVWTLTVSNAADSCNASNTKLAILMSSDFVYITSFTLNGTYDDGVWDIGFMENATTAELTVIAYANKTANHTLTTVFVGADEVNLGKTVAYNYIDIMDIPGIEMTVSNNRPHYEDEIIYTLTISNNATVNYTSVLTVIDTLPDGFKFIKTLNISGAAIDTPEYVDGQRITWQITNITTDTPAVITFKAKALKTGSMTNAVTVMSAYGHDHSAECTVNVEAKATKLAANSITTTYNINRKLVITLKDANGKALAGFKVTVKLKGTKTYKTDKNGQIKISTKGLAPKKYTAKITFNGDKNYAKSAKNVKVTVKKAKPKITAKKKVTYKAKAKTKKLKITLKDNTGKPIKNAKVRLMLKKIGKGGKKNTKTKANKKIAKTNKKGKATFKIKKNKKAKYQAYVKFYTNKYYKKTVKKVKITIK